MQKAKAQFQIHATFRITGRGIVMAGRIEEGFINIGDELCFEFEGNYLKRTIIGIERIASLGNRFTIGLLVKCKDEAEIERLRNWSPNLQICQIEPTNTNHYSKRTKMNSLISSNFIKVEDLNLHYLSAGEGEVILFLHGWPTSAYLWRNMMPTLAEKYRVIALDLPGFGKSDKHLEDSYSFKYYNRTIDGFLKNLGVEKVTLGLHDLGGPLGLYWAVQNMERVNRLVLLNTLVYPDFSWGVKLFGLATMIPGLKSWITSPKGISKAMNFGVQKNELLTNEVIAEYQAPFQGDTSRKVLLKSVQRLSVKGFHEIAEKLPSFNKPVQIIYGAKDRILPKVKDTMDRVKKDLPQAKVKIFEDCGHFLQEEVPEQIAQVLMEFMSEK
ncbi:MAG: alpha/beta fold hydrolase [Chitinophagales bacterium]